MGSNFEYAGSSLLCGEEESSVFDEDDGGFPTNLHKQDPILLQIQTDHCLDSLFDKEIHHLPALDYLNRFRTGLLDLASRNQAIHWIHKVQSHYNFGPLCLYLAINYLDRFLSVYQLPSGKAWMMQLLAVACLSLAAKMEETQVPFLLDLQVGEPKFVFEAKTIQRMEVLVMSTLKWRMQAVTPFAFIDYYLYKMNGDEMPAKTSILQSIQLILTTIKGIEFLEFRASEIAGAVAFSVTQHTQNSDKLFSLLCNHINKEKLSKCVELMHELIQKGGIVSTSSVPQSPNGVLDASTYLTFHTHHLTSSTHNNTHHLTSSTHNNTHHLTSSTHNNTHHLTSSTHNTHHLTSSANSTHNTPPKRRKLPTN